MRQVTVHKTNLAFSPFRKLPEAVVQDEKLNYCAKVSFAALKEAAGTSNVTYLGTDKIAEQVGFKKASVRKALTSLRKEGYILFEKVYSTRKIYVQSSVYSVSDIEPPKSNIYNTISYSPISYIYPSPLVSILSQNAEKSKSKSSYNTDNDVVKERFSKTTKVLSSGLHDRFGNTPTRRLLEVAKTAHFASTHEIIPKVQLAEFFGTIRRLLRSFGEYQIAVMILLHYGRVRINGKSSASSSPKLPMQVWERHPDTQAFENFCTQRLGTSLDIFDRDLKAILVASIHEMEEICEYWTASALNNDNLPTIT